MTYPGKLIVFDGIDGSGKGEMLVRAESYLSKKFPGKVVKTKEPGGTSLGMAIRRLLFEEFDTKGMAPGVCDLLFLASHIQNWQRLVKPALEDGKIVLSDRWWMSQEVYSTQREVPKGISAAYKMHCGKRADLFFLLHGDVKTMVDRARARTTETHQSGKAWDDYEVLRAIQNKYLETFIRDPETRAICVDGKSLDQVWNQVQYMLDEEI